MLPWKLRKLDILPVNQNRSSVYFSLAKFQLVSSNLSLAMIWQMTYTHKMPKLCSATLNEIQTMFSQLAKRSAKVLPADLCSDHAHYVKIYRSTVLRRNKNMAIEGGTVSHDYILVIRKFIDFMSLFRHSV